MMWHEDGARLAGAQYHALDVDRVARVGAEEVARHARTLDVPRNEGCRPRHFGIEAAEVGTIDALPVVVDALGRLALLYAELLGARRTGLGEGDGLTAVAEPFRYRQEHHRRFGAPGLRRRLALPRRGGARSTPPPH